MGLRTTPTPPCPRRTGSHRARLAQVERRLIGPHGVVSVHSAAFYTPRLRLLALAVVKAFLCTPESPVVLVPLSLPPVTRAATFERTGRATGRIGWVECSRQGMGGWVCQSRPISANGSKKSPKRNKGSSSSQGTEKRERAGRGSTVFRNDARGTRRFHCTRTTPRLIVGRRFH